MGIELYVGGHANTVQGERYDCPGPRMLTAAHRPPAIPPNREDWLLDSGAFTDSPEKRLTSEQALERQLRYEQKASKHWGEWLPFSQVRGREQREAVSHATIAGQSTYFGMKVVAGPEGAITGTTQGVRPEQINRVGKKKAGRLLDGRTWDEFPTMQAVRT